MRFPSRFIPLTGDYVRAAVAVAAAVGIEAADLVTEVLPADKVEVMRRAVLLVASRAIARLAPLVLPRSWNVNPPFDPLRGRWVDDDNRRGGSLRPSLHG